MSDFSHLERIPQPPQLKVQLYAHQLVSVFNMEELEKTKRIPVKDKKNTYYTTQFGILADSVGHGKSYSIVALILRDKMEWSLSTDFCSDKVTSIGNMLRLYEEVKMKKVKTNLVLANAVLITQWETYFKSVKKGNLAVATVTVKKDILNVISNFTDYDVILISTERYNEFIDVVGDQIAWKRFVFDDAGATNIPNMRKINAGFTWFVSATYRDLLSIRNRGFIPYVFKGLETHILEDLIIKNSDEFCKLSFVMPKIEKIDHTCFEPVILRTLGNMIDEETRVMISAGNIEMAISRLGNGITDSENLIEIITIRHKEEVETMENTLKRLEKRVPRKETEIAELKKKIQEKQNSISCLEERFKESLESDCPVCYDKIQNPVLLKCCQNIFCTNCVSRLLLSTKKCPMCRAVLEKTNVIPFESKKNLELQEEKKEDLPLSKEQTLGKIILENKNGRFLIFSNYNESFRPIKSYLTEQKIDFEELSGTKSVKDAKIAKYRSGETKVLFLNSRFNGAGINLVETTDIIFYHAFLEDETNQNIGRAMRIGRKQPLRVHNFVY